MIAGNRLSLGLEKGGPCRFMHMAATECPQNLLAASDSGYLDDMITMHTIPHLGNISGNNVVCQVQHGQQRRDRTMAQVSQNLCRAVSAMVKFREATR
jgi:hypothetical protein